MAGLGFVRQGVRDSGSLTWYVLCRFNKDGCLSSAAALSYTTLLAMVPLLALALGILTGFPGFEDVHARIQSFVLRKALSARLSARLFISIRATSSLQLRRRQALG